MVLKSAIICQSKVKLRKALFIHNIKFVKMKLNIPNMHELVKKTKLSWRKTGGKDAVSKENVKTNNRNKWNKGVWPWGVCFLASWRTGHVANVTDDRSNISHFSLMAIACACVCARTGRMLTCSQDLLQCLFSKFASTSLVRSNRLWGEGFQLTGYPGVPT